MLLRSLVLSLRFFFAAICKRIRAVEGDVVFLRSSPFRIERVILEKGQIWVQGDNPSNSLDSRMYGPLDKSALQGRVFWKCNWNKYHCEKVEKEFEYCSIADERADTKVLRAGAQFIPTLPNGDSSPSTQNEDSSLPTENENFSSQTVSSSTGNVSSPTGGVSSGTGDESQN